MSCFPMSQHVFGVAGWRGEKKNIPNRPEIRGRFYEKSALNEHHFISIPSPNNIHTIHFSTCNFQSLALISGAERIFGSVRIREEISPGQRTTTDVEHAWQAESHLIPSIASRRNPFSLSAAAKWLSPLSKMARRSVLEPPTNVWKMTIISMKSWTKCIENHPNSLSYQNKE